ncbi:P22AR C-terminal domain-containing protein, partial [Escherichia coli]|nr:phage antirepressor Ant [Escherichia coli]
MATQISVETLSPITHNQIPVITTELLAQLYCTEINNIKVNYTRNSERFVEGKHFFKVVGDELKILRVTLSNSQNLQPSLRGLQISPKARSLILWTERGAARHAKMLETDQAWEVFEKLEDCYFSQCEKNTGKQEKKLNGLSAKETDSLVWLWDYANRSQALFRELYPALKQIQSNYSGRCYDYGHEFSYVIGMAR